MRVQRLQLAGTTPAASDSGTPADSSSPAAGASLATTSEVPVGSALIVTDQKVVLTQPTAGTIKAYSAICTHQSCVVAKVDGATIICPCHGSTYSAADGSVLAGPAPAPLNPVNVTVTGDTITLA